MRARITVPSNLGIGWHSLVLKPYHLISTWRHRTDRRLNKCFSLLIQKSWDSPYRLIRYIVLPAIVFLKRFLHFILRQLELEVIELQKPGESSSEEKRLFYVGDKRYLRYWIARVLGEESMQRPRGRVPIWRLDEEVKRFAEEGLPVIFEVPMILKWRPKLGVMHSAPSSVEMVFRYENLESEQLIQKKFHAQRENLKRAHKAGLKIEVGDIHRDFTFWYERMLLPLALNRHGAYAETGDKDSMKELAQKRGIELFFVVNQEGMRVAGSLSLITKTVFHGLYFGLLDGNYDYARKGALAYLYYFSFVEGLRRGCKLLDGGEAMSLLCDGVLQHKLLWGCEPVENPWGNHRVIFWAPDNSPEAVRFVEEYPLISGVKSYVW